MQIGMIGPRPYGRETWCGRLLRGGHECVRLTTSIPTRWRSWWRNGRIGRRHARRVRRQAQRRRAPAWIMVAGWASPRSRWCAKLGGAPREKGDAIVDGGQTPISRTTCGARRPWARKGSITSTPGTSGRRLGGSKRGPTALMIGGERSEVERARSDLENAGARERATFKPALGREGKQSTAEEGLPPLRSGRRPGTSSKWFTTAIEYGLMAGLRRRLSTSSATPPPRSCRRRIAIRSISPTSPSFWRRGQRGLVRGSSTLNGERPRRDPGPSPSTPASSRTRAKGGGR